MRRGPRWTRCAATAPTSCRMPIVRRCSIACGVAPPFVGMLPLVVARQLVDEIVLVSEAEIMDAMAALMLRAKLYVEGAGAAATAALLARKARVPQGSVVVSIVSGGNVDP